jgi:pyroglutamyl-peptidase
VKQRVLLFGFEHFGDYFENPSEIVCRRLEGKSVGGCRVLCRVLPVEYKAVEAAVVGDIDSHKPILVLGLGLAAGRSQIYVEKVALNFRDVNLKDNSGFRPEHDRIELDGPVALEAKIPVNKAVESLRGAGIPAKLSLSAGGYLCNNVMYLICREARRRGILGGFVHLPAHEELVAKLGRDIPSMNISTMIRSIRLIIETVLNHNLVERQQGIAGGEPNHRRLDTQAKVPRTPAQNI